jgi:hypothetical protein
MGLMRVDDQVRAESCRRDITGTCIIITHLDTNFG